MRHGQHGKIRHKLVESEVLRCILIALGWFSIVAGIVGIFLPLVPSIPFLLLALFCFSRSSHKFHDWLVEHKHLGPMVKDYLLHGGIPLRAKTVAICMIWVSFPASTFLLVETVWIRIVLLSVALVVTVYLLCIPTATPAKGVDEERDR